MSNILTGTADITNGSPTVTLHGMAALTAANCPGDSPIQINGRGYFVSAVTSTTTVSLTRNVAEATGAGVACEISPYVAQTVATVTLNARTSTLLNEIEAIDANGRGLFYIYEGSSSDVDPGAGKLCLNNGTPSAATAIYISETDANSPPLSVDGLLGLLANGHLLLIRSVATAAYAAYLVSAALTDEGTFRRATGLTYVDGDGILSVGEAVGLSFFNAAAVLIDTDGTLAANSDTRVASQKAVKTYVNGIVAAQDAMVFKGVIDCSANPNYPAADRGWTYRVSVAGKIGGASGIVVEIGDMAICLTDGTVTGTQAAVGSAWSIIQTNIDGAVTTTNLVTGGTDNALLRADGTGGHTTQASPVIVDDAGNMSGLALLTTNGQVKFPASQNASADPNTLDDYEEGSFTPTVVGQTTAGAGTYSTQAGHYIKIGARVFFDIELAWSAHTGTGNMKIGALPFAAGARNSAVALQPSNLTAANPLYGYVESGASTINLGTAATAAAYTALAIDTAATIRVSGSYSTV